MKRLFCVILIVLVTLSGCKMSSDKGFEYMPNTTGKWDINSSPLNGAPLMENKNVYDNEFDDKIDSLYLTVYYGKDERKQPEYSFADLNNYTGDGDEPYCDIIMAEGKDGEGPSFGSFGFGESMPNAQLTVKGNVSNVKPRSYQVKLYDRAGLYKGVRTLNLIKSLDDLSRMKEKMCFDLIQPIENMASIRTRFTRVFIKDKTSNSNEYTDMGFFTYIEQPNKTYLQSRGFDTEANLYKAKDFNFSRYEDKIIPKGEAGYDKDSFEQVLTIREGDPDSTLTKMLDDVNNTDNNFDEVFKKYFNEENVLTYCAINILFSNIEAYNEDYLLLNPRNSSTFYFIPGSFKKAFDNKLGYKDEKIPQSLIGYSFLQNNVLFNRYFQQQENIDKLSAKVDELHKSINKKAIDNYITKYKFEVLKVLYSVPELFLLPKQAEDVEPYMDSLGDILEENYNLFKQNVAKPIAPYITNCSSANNQIKIKWNDVYNLTPDNIAKGHYILEFATSSDFNRIVYKSEPIYSNEITISDLNMSKYYIRLTYFNEKGRSQQCSNITQTKDGRKYYGCDVLEMGL